MNEDESHEQPQEEPSEARREAPREALAERPRRGLHDTSGPAIAATAALVLFSVFIGVFGPRIGNRQQAPAGVTLVELAEAVVSRSQPHFNQARVARVAEMTEQDFAARVEEIIAHGVALPSLEAHRLEATSVQRVRLPGGRGSLAVIRSTDPRDPQLAAVAIIEDEDRLTVYDRYSRPIAMPKGEVFSIPESLSNPPGVVEVYREGDFVIAVHAFSPEFAREIVAAMQSAGAARGSRSRRPTETAEPAPVQEP